MPEIKIRYRFVGESEEWTEIEIIEPVNDVGFYIRNRNNEYNTSKPLNEPEREVLSVYVTNPWIHLHNFKQVHGQLYYMCRLCGMKTILVGKNFHPLQGWEGPEHDYCQEKLPKLPPVKKLKTIKLDIEFVDPEGIIRKLPPLK